jgi:hypothetical protein
MELGVESLQTRIMEGGEEAKKSLRVWIVDTFKAILRKRVSSK